MPSSQAIKFVMMALCLGSVFVEAKDLPSYIKACRLSDDKLSECATKSANNAMPFIVKGDEKYHIPNMTPLKISNAAVNVGANLKIHFSEAIVSGLENGQLRKFELSKGKTLTGELSYKEMVVKGNYDMNGNIFLLPIKGSGYAEIKFDNIVFQYTFNLTAIKDRGAEEYYGVKRSKIAHKVDRVHFRFDNLFNGDKTLGDHMNKFMNDNWQAMERDFAVSLDGIVKALVDATVNGYISKVPKNQTFLP